MSQGPLCPNLSKKVQKEVSQMTNRNLPHVMLCDLSVNLNHLKIVILDNIFSHLSANFEVKIQNTHQYRSRLNFSTSEKLALNSPGNGPPVRYSKIQNRLSRAP